MSLNQQTLPPVILVAGPSGAGKGTLVRNLARKLNLFEANVGLIFRATAWELLQLKIKSFFSKSNFSSYGKSYS